MHKYCEQNKLNVFDYMPITFIIHFGNSNHIQEVEKFCTYYKLINKHKDKDTELSQLTAKIFSDRR